MAPSRRDIDPKSAERFQQLRDEAAAVRQQLIDQAPAADDALGRVAWMAGADGNPDYPFNNDLREAINTAREARMTWREISVALGEDDDQGTADRVNAKQMWRNKAYADRLAGDNNPGIAE